MGAEMGVEMGVATGVGCAGGVVGTGETGGDEMGGGGDETGGGGIGTGGGTGTGGGGGTVTGTGCGVGDGWGAGAGLGLRFPPQVLKLPLHTIKAITNAMITSNTTNIIQHLAFFQHMWRLRETAVRRKLAALLRINGHQHQHCS